MGTKHATKHIVTHYRGQPVKGRPPRKRPVGALRTRGPLPDDPELHDTAPADTRVTYLRSLAAEREQWDIDAADDGTTIGPWLRKLANKRSAELRARAARRKE